MNPKSILRQCNSWADFRRRLENLTPGEKGDCFEELTLYLLKLHPTYKTKIEEVWLLSSVPLGVRKALNLPEPDKGIDLVAKTREGEYWSIQCKYRSDETESLTLNDLSTFTSLSFVIGKGISHALVCTNVERLSDSLSLYGEKVSFCASDVWRGLDEDFFKELHAIIDGKEFKAEPLQPRDYQEEAIKNGCEHFLDNGESRGKLIMPCGTGKSLIGYWLTEKLLAAQSGACNVLIAVPSLALLRQTLGVWTKESVAVGRYPNWIVVCSDQTVKEFDDSDSSTMVRDLGVRVHTDEEEITSWLKDNQAEQTIVFTTYQSGKVTAQAVKKAGITFDVGIFDEAHKTVGRSDSLFSHLLFEPNVSVAKRIFMTATERRYHGQSDQLVSMDDPKIYGDTFEVLTYKEALEKDPPILSDYKIVALGIEREEVAKLIEKNVFVRPDKGKWNDDLEAAMLASLVGLRKAFKEYGIKHAVSFHKAISRAKAFKDNNEKFNDTFREDYEEVRSFHVTGKTPTRKRSDELEKFAACDRGLITNARCLTEGVDVPNIDCVLFADPKHSAIDIVQATGRALRTAEGKEMAYVIIPVLLDKNTADDLDAYEGEYQSILTIVRGLAAHDERIIEYFRAVSEGRKPSGKHERFSCNIPAILRQTIDAERFADSVEPWLWSKLGKLDWRPFEEAREFARDLKLKSQDEWEAYCRGDLKDTKGLKPPDIPSAPDKAYKDKGWVSWGDWLGTGTISTQGQKFLPFEEAREFVHSLKLKGEREWKVYSRGDLKDTKGTRPPDIPSAPDQVYKGKGWVSYGDWLGTGTIATKDRKFLPFEEAREFVHKRKLKSREEWSAYCRGDLKDTKDTLPTDIPSTPQRAYKDKGWKGYGDWLGTGGVAPYRGTVRPFQEAREFARSLKLKGWREWKSYCRGDLKDTKGTRPPDIPSAPDKSYKGKGWKGNGDWLGTEFRPFEEAREFVHKRKLKSQKEWWAYCGGDLEATKDLRPPDIPANPARSYKGKGWKGMGDWLGTEWRLFEEAREFARSLKLKSKNEWEAYCRGDLKATKGLRPPDIPGDPYKVYKGKGWVSWTDWRGYG